MGGRVPAVSLESDSVGLYLVLAAAFGFMLHVRKRNRQRYSEACRPIMGKQTDGIGGRLIDLLAVFALLAGTATTFSVATPLMASAINALFPYQSGPERSDNCDSADYVFCVHVFAASRLPRNRFSGKSSASICFSGCWCTCCCSADRRGILSRRDFHRWDG